MSGAEPRYVVFGAGAVGGVAAALLERAGHEVCAVARGAHLAAMADSGLLVRTPELEYRARLPVVSSAELAIDRERDVILLTVKSQDTRAAVEQIVRAGGDDALVVCADNGVANESAAARVTRRVGAAMVWTPAVFLSPGVVESYARPCPALWALGTWPRGKSARIERLARDLEAAGIAAPLVGDVMRFKHAKLLDNLGNAVDALFDVGSDDSGIWREVLEQLRAEGEACLRAARVDWAAPAEVAALLGDRVTVSSIRDAVRAGGSTWQSLARGAAALELEYLNGEVCALGALHGVPTPVNRAVLRVAAAILRERRAPRSATRDELERARRASLSA
jgi:2-dehydropantoate 2-reductase